MGKLTAPILFLVYFALGGLVAATVWRGGSDGGTAFAAFIGTVGIGVAFHAYAAQVLNRNRLTRDIDNVREAHRLMVDAIDSTQKDMIELADRVQHQRSSRSEELTSEVRMLEDLVKKLGESIEDRLNEWQSAPVAAAPRSHPVNAREAQALALIETIREALTENRVDLYLQPVVSLPQRKTIFYESFSRLRDMTGRVLMPAEYLSVADAEGLVPSIDNLLLFRCVQIVRRLAKQDRRIGIFCNISMASLVDETFFPQFLELLTANRDLSGALIFEIGQAAFDARGSIEARNMGKLADLGFRFSLDKVADLDLDLQDLSRSDVKFLKLGAQMVIDELTEVDGRLVLRALPDLAAEDFTALTRRYGVDVIVEKVETERQVVDILELNVAYGQGHLFGEPRAIKDAVLAEADPPPAFLHPQAPRRAAFG
jgi:cyclic-di-GMP phosphodiesterase TipF (flagellum assembly factor)